MREKNIEQAYRAARELYQEYGVDTETVLERLKQIEISMHCWQGDDVTGLEASGGGASGGIMATGQYPGKPRDGDELRADIDLAMRLLPGRQRLNLHASYAELGGEKVDRDRYETRHFTRWIDWATARGIGIDFNPTCFGHPRADANLTLANPDKEIRRFWIDHCLASRKIAADIGRKLKTAAVNNIWVPDGMKDIPADRTLYRDLLKSSLDEILAVTYSGEHLIDAVECKLFGVGVESYTVGSHEFYMGYVNSAIAAGRDNLLLTLDMGHFHPTEAIADKISALLLFLPRLLVHVSRGVKWDSDHVVITDDNLLDVMREIKRADAFDRVFIATDFFDGSINRVAAWVIGIRATRKAILAALLEPTELLQKVESEGNYTARLALMDEVRSLPAAAVWNQFCLRENVPAGSDYLAEIRAYEQHVLAERKI